MSTAKTAPKGFLFTGKHMIAIMVSFFGVIISVNVLMAYLASSTWSGLVVENTYVASQQFNEKATLAKTWQASGIKGEVSVAGPVVVYTLTRSGTEPMDADRVEAAFHRPVGTHQDFKLSLVAAGQGRFEAKHVVLAGEWIVDLTTYSKDAVIFHEARRIHVGDGAI